MIYLGTKFINSTCLMKNFELCLCFVCLLFTGRDTCGRHGISPGGKESRNFT